MPDLDSGSSSVGRGMTAPEAPNPVPQDEEYLSFSLNNRSYTTVPNTPLRGSQNGEMPDTDDQEWET